MTIDQPSSIKTGHDTGLRSEDVKQQSAVQQFFTNAQFNLDASSGRRVRAAASIRIARTTGRELMTTCAVASQLTVRDSPASSAVWPFCHSGTRLRPTAENQYDGD